MIVKKDIDKKLKIFCGTLTTIELQVYKNNLLKKGFMKKK